MKAAGAHPSIFVAKLICQMKEIDKLLFKHQKKNHEKVWPIPNQKRCFKFLRDIYKKVHKITKNYDNFGWLQTFLCNLFP
jgi:hypothetical protein